MKSELSISGLEVRFAGIRALQGVNLDVRAEEILGVLGPNGAGKTTLVNAITGFVKPASGTISLAGRSLHGRSPRHIVKMGISRSFQAARLFRRLTVRENIEVAALGSGASSAEASRRAAELLDVMRLEEVETVRADALPYGLERRVAIARAAASQPTLMLLDEPAAGMTPAEADVLVEDIERVKEHLDCSVLLIEHDVPFVMRISHRAVVLDQGTIIADGAPEEVVALPRVQKAYFGIDAEVDAAEETDADDGTAREASVGNGSERGSDA